MPSPVHKPTDLSPEELADRTLELDMRWLQYDDLERPEKSRDPNAPKEDPTVVLDLTATQVHDLLMSKKK